MLKLYIGKNDLPSGISFIEDVEAAFPLVTITGSSFQREVIACIENGTYNDEKTFIDRFGEPAKYDWLCTGSKALMLLESRPDVIINFTECGDNALTLLSKLDNGMLYFEDRCKSINFDVDYPVFYKGVSWKGVSQVNSCLC